MPVSSMDMTVDPSSPEVMLTFYKRLYPFKSIFNWLNHEHTPTRLFTHREFAFTLQGDVYLRYNSFNSAEELKKQVCALNPTRFEIGPVYTARVSPHEIRCDHDTDTGVQPRDKKTLRPGALSPVLRELVFDIDMTDYDSIRTCCSAAAICTRCWAFISAAVRVIHSAIQDQFGYTHLLWVYSGRRGIHLWISDKEAMELTDDERKAIVGWLNIFGSTVGGKINVRVGSRALPPALQYVTRGLSLCLCLTTAYRAALDHLANEFTPLILTDQNCFASQEGYEALLQLIPDRAVVEILRKKWSSDPDRPSEDKWSDLKAEIKKYDKGSSQRVSAM